MNCEICFLIINYIRTIQFFYHSVAVQTLASIDLGFMHFRPARYNFSKMLDCLPDVSNFLRANEYLNCSFKSVSDPEGLRIVFALSTGVTF